MTAEDEAEFRVLFADHFDDLWRFARRRVTTAADADDVTAETFAVAWRRHDQLPQEHSVRLWLFGVARHVLANRQRAEGRRHRLRLRLMETQQPSTAPDLPDQPGGSLGEAFRALGADDREVLIMRCWDGLAVHDIASLLGCTPNAVSLRLHKARRRLQELLAEKDPQPAGQVEGDPFVRKERRHG